jgi:hypothetical protein
MAPFAPSMTMSPRNVLTELELLRLNSCRSKTNEQLRGVLEDRIDSLAHTPGFQGAALHQSDDGLAAAWIWWTDEASRRSARAEARDNDGAMSEVAAYETAAVDVRDGGPLRIDAAARFVTLIDVFATNPASQRETLGFNAKNTEALAAQRGWRATVLLRGRDGTHVATYSQWDRVEDWIAAVKTVAGDVLPDLKNAGTTAAVNAALAKRGRDMGAIPEYHAYRVSSIVKAAPVPHR